MATQNDGREPGSKIRHQPGAGPWEPRKSILKGLLHVTALGVETAVASTRRWLNLRG